jgi:hypothetical protein
MTLPEPIPPPECLPDLLNIEMRLAALRQELDDVPQSLDSQAAEVHTALVVPAYKAMKTDVANACGRRWNDDSRQDFRDAYQAAADWWPSYEAALAELDRARSRGLSTVEALNTLKNPRRGYIDALFSFYDKLYGTLKFFFPSCFPSS